MCRLDFSLSFARSFSLSISPSLSQSVELTRAGSHMCVFTKHLSNFQYTTIHSINRAQRDSQAVKFLPFVLSVFISISLHPVILFIFMRPLRFFLLLKLSVNKKKWANAAFFCSLNRNLDWNWTVCRTRFYYMENLFEWNWIRQTIGWEMDTFRKSDNSYYCHFNVEKESGARDKSIKILVNCRFECFVLHFIASTSTSRRFVEHL